MSEQFKYLFTPLKVGSIEVRNRIVYLPTGTGFGQDGHPTEEQAYYLADRAKGGAGLVFCANLMAHPTSLVPFPRPLSGIGEAERWAALFTPTRRSSLGCHSLIDG